MASKPATAPKTSYTPGANIVDEAKNDMMTTTVRVSDLGGDAQARLMAVVERQVEKARNEYAEATRAIYEAEGLPALNVPNVAPEADRIWSLVKPTARSGNRAVRPSKPKGDGRAAYVWRMLRFHLGEDVHMPVTADWDLYNEVDREMGFDEQRSHYLRDEERRVRYDRYKAEQKRMDAVVDYILATMFPLRQFRGALAWKGLLY